MKSHSLISLLQRDDPKETLRLVRFLLGKLPDFPLEFYTTVGDYEDGLSFVAFCYDILLPVWKRITPEDRQKWDITLICVKLEMLDRLQRWEEYDRYFLKMYTTHPDYQCIYNKNALHLKIDRASPYLIGEDADYIYVHFLYLLLPRFEAIRTYLKHFPAGSRKRKKLMPPAVPNQAELRGRFEKMSERFKGLLGIDTHILEKHRNS